VPEPTVAQRIVRAKRTLAETRVPFELPRPDELTSRLGSVLEVIYLVFNEGYAATAGDDWMRPALCDDALRLGRVLAELLPDEPEAHGLVALMEIQASRSRARVGPSGKVYANDIQPEMLRLLRRNAARANVTNVETVLGTETDPKLPVNALDLILMVDVYHEFSEPQKMLRRMHEELKPGGRLVLLEGASVAPGGSALAQMRLENPAVAARGDRFVIRFNHAGARPPQSVDICPAPLQVGK
jgi:SAM-dependent methyltransferase